VQSLGIDIGSRTIELVLLEDGEVALHRRLETTFDPLAQCRRILDGVSCPNPVATGYGRKLFIEHFGGRAITEIQAYARGARHLFSACRSILDIGGQDTKAIALSPDGRVSGFEMNDKCAAGTGKFLELMARAFQMPVEDFGGFALGGQPGMAINSLCTVFAETEATSLMASGTPPADIALALHDSVVRRSLAMLEHTRVEPPLVFAGGVARNPCMAELVGRYYDILIPEEPDLVGALGAALHAAQ